MKKLITVIFILVCCILGFIYNEYTKDVPTLTLYETTNPNAQLNEITKNTQTFKEIPKKLKKYDRNTTYWIEATFNKTLKKNKNYYIFYEGFEILYSSNLDKKITPKLIKGRTLYHYYLKKDVKNYHHYLKINNINTPNIYIKDRRQYEHWINSSFSESKTILNGIILGIMFMVFIYTISIYIYIQEKSFLYYSLMQISMIPVVLYHTDFVMWNNLYYNLFALLSSFFSILFVQFFLETKEYLPKSNKILEIYLALSIIDFVHLIIMKSSLICDFQMYSIFALFYLFIAYLRIKQGLFSAKIFLIGWTILIFSLLLTEWMRSIQKLYPFSFDVPIVTFFTLGPVGESFLFSLALAYKWKTVQNENEKQKSILVQQTKRASLGEQMAFISHQWKTPLHGLLMTINNTQNENENGTLTKEKLTRKLDRATNRILFMSDTINWFQGFYSTTKNKEEFSIDKSTNELVSMMKDMFIEKNINITINIIEDFIIKSYKNEYQQVLLNLLTNAKHELLNRDIKKPEIIITVNTNYISVSDNAGGINNENIDDIFNQEVTTKNSLGLGLYMSKKIIEKSMAGTLNVENGIDGAIFRITL